jgi:hypothetical protein
MTGPLTWSLNLEDYRCLEMHDLPFNLELELRELLLSEMHDWPFNLELELGSVPVPVDRAG